MSRRILLVNATLAGYGGTAIATRDLASGLKSRGHHVFVYAPAPGPFADALTAAGVSVASTLDDVREPPDIVHGYHFLPTVEALMRFPGARGVFVCHDRDRPHAIPPRLDRIRRYVAVDDDCLERLREDWRLPPNLTRVIRSAVDTRRFVPRGSLPESPKRALVFDHRASPATHENAVRDACAHLGIEVDVLGASARTAIPDPERVIGRYDLVFAKGRCALEAMAVGAAVVLCDVTGVGPMVTCAELPGLRAWGFGARVLGGRLDRDTLVREIGRYDPAEAAAVSRAIREEASLALALSQYENLYDEALGDDMTPEVILALASAPPRPAAAGADLVRDLTDPLLARIGDLERALAAYRRPERMPALADSSLAALHVSIDEAPAALVAGTTTFVHVRLENGLTDETLGTWPPFPLQWSYRWRPDGAAEFPEQPAMRTPFPRAVPPGTTMGFAVAVQAPSEPGRFVLRIALVQEELRWLDRTVSPVCADVSVQVTDG